MISGSFSIHVQTRLARVSSRGCAVLGSQATAIRRSASTYRTAMGQVGKAIGYETRKVYIKVSSACLGFRSPP